MAGPVRDPEVEPTPVAASTPATPTATPPATPVEGPQLATAAPSAERERATYGERTQPAPEEVVVENRKSVYGRERAEYGGIKFGVAFFGWLTATGLLVMLTAIAAAIIAAFGFQNDPNEVDFGAALASAIVLMAILFVSYLAGGYVAGRMARFAGVKQGLAVWIWGMVVTGVLVAVAAIAGSQLDVLSTFGVVPQISFGPDAVLGTALTIAGAIVVTLLGAILGGVAGMRFHRRVDRAGWAE